MNENNKTFGFNKDDFLSELDQQLVSNKEEHDKKYPKTSVGKIDVDDVEESEEKTEEVSDKKPDKIGLAQKNLPFQKYIDDNNIQYQSFLGLYEYNGQTFVGCSKAATCDKKSCNGCDILSINFNRLLLFERMAFSPADEKPTTLEDDEVYTAFIK